MKKQRYQAIRKVTIVSASTNSCLAIFKIIVGYVAHSHALLADGLHSLSDLITDALVLVASKAGGRQPDLEHPYGHRRIETFATIVIAIILIAVAGSIIFETWQYVTLKKSHPLPEIYSIIAAIISIVANEGLYHYCRLVGKKINSNLLLSNAWHNRTDVLTSFIVLISIVGTLLGFYYLDAIGAIIIALFIAYIGCKMIWQSGSELIDTAVDKKTRQAIMHIIQNTPGVVSIHQLRSRTHGGNIFIDVHILVNPFISVSEGHHIGELVHDNLCKNFDHISDVTVHIDPENDETYKPSIHLPTRPKIEAELRSLWHDLPGFTNIQRINLHYLQGKIFVEVYMSNHLSVKKQRHLTNLYCATASTIDNVANIVIHFIPQ